MDQQLIRHAKNAEDVAAGLQVFLDRVPQYATDISAIISELFATSSATRALHTASDDLRYARAFHTIRSDLDLVLRSLQYTLGTVRGIFARTGLASYRVLWDGLNLFVQTEGSSLCTRLEWYKIFLHDLFDVLRSISTGRLIVFRERIKRLLIRQESPETHIPNLSADAGASRTPRPELQRFQSFSSYHVRAPQSSIPNIWDDLLPPLAPDPPPPISPTFSSASSQTLSSSQTSFSNRPPPPHWAQLVFDGQHPVTSFRASSQVSKCYGRDEPEALQGLVAAGFVEVLETPFDAAGLRLRLYWRPADHRARVLILTQDRVTRQKLHYCIPLTALKVVRSESSLQLYRAGTPDLLLWANLKFTIYERMVLFYCTFVAMKRQDAVSILPHLDDLFQLREEVEFAGEIQDDSYLHALRLFRDPLSGGMRLEGSALRGPMQNTPIWTAFITLHLASRSWLQWVESKVVWLKDLKPYVFCEGYSPPRARTGEFELRFTTRDDAEDFVERVKELRPR
ncbi:hypothetical protein LTR50_002069 [Elasticomyces elasticus]|nr:hypothetical protein LTR50_002069 [Elasticomyces elasticus]